MFSLGICPRHQFSGLKNNGLITLSGYTSNALKEVRVPLQGHSAMNASRNKLQILNFPQNHSVDAMCWIYMSVKS